MRVLLTLPTAVFLSIGLSAATTDCNRDSLNNYVDHGTCAIEDKLFDFTSFSTSGGPMDGMITISPLETPLDPGVLFQAPWAVDAQGDFRNADRV